MKELGLQNLVGQKEIMKSVLDFNEQLMDRNKYRRNMIIMQMTKLDISL